MSRTRRYYTYQNLDFRFEKSIHLGNFGELGVYIDIFNLLGHHYVNINQNPGGTWFPDYS